MSKLFALSLLIVFSFKGYATDKDKSCGDLFENIGSSEEVSKHLQNKDKFKQEAIDRTSQSEGGKDFDVSDLEDLSLLGKSSKQKSLRSKGKSKSRNIINLSKKRQEALRKFIYLVTSEKVDYPQIRQLVEEYSFLKKYHFGLSDFHSGGVTLKPIFSDPQSALFDSMNSDHPIDPRYAKWFPNGITALQWFGYTKNYEIFHFLMALGFGYRTLKKPGGESTEHNVLHIAIKRNDIRLAKSILELDGVASTEISGGADPTAGKKPFVDEKTDQKHTPWLLALLRWERTKDMSFLNLIANHHPSIHVSSFYKDQSFTNWDVTEEVAGSNKEILLLRKMMYGDLEKHDLYNKIKQENYNSGLRPPAR